MKLYIGKISKINPSTHVIDFYIPDLYPDGSNLPKAIPLSRLTRIAESGDEVMIVQVHDDIELFYYIQTLDQTNAVSLEYGDSKVELLHSGDININAMKDINITAGGEVKITAGFGRDVNINDKITASSIKVDIKGNSMMLNGAAGIGFYPSGGAFVPSLPIAAVNGVTFL